MSLSKRIFDLARSNLNALLDRAGGEGGSLDDLSDDELEAELERRRERRRREDEERGQRVAAERAARERAAQRAAQAAAARAAAGGASARPSNGTPPRSESRRPPPAAPPGSERRMRELYAQLEVPYGAPFDEVKKSFRRLMRKYHPDLHVGNPQKQKTATQLTMSLTQAYNEIEQHLLGGPNRR
jgi:DnaJ-domain-containing protein 1